MHIWVLLSVLTLNNKNGLFLWCNVHHSFHLSRKRSGTLPLASNNNNKTFIAGSRAFSMTLWPLSSSNEQLLLDWTNILMKLFRHRSYLQFSQLLFYCHLLLFQLFGRKVWNLENSPSMPKRDQIQHCCSRVIVLLTKRLRAAHPISKQKRWASSVSRESKRSNSAASFRLLCNYSDSKAQQLHPTIFGNPRDVFTLHQTQNTKWNHTENEMPTITTLSLDDVQKHPTELVRCLSFFFFFW